MQSKTPVVSIITATYNRSNVLQYAIASVIGSTFTDWELLVVGDACTDDTEQVVARFNDQRVRFMNLEQNVGEQSGPNNEGFRHARGRYIAYLNHDDLWMPDHLETALRGIEKTNADLVFTLGIAIKPEGSNILLGAAPDCRYYPSFAVPASLWLLKRELIDEVGPWRFYQERYTVPSQDWLIRAWKAGKDMRLIPQMTVIAIVAGSRPNVYANREFEENKHYFERICSEPTFRERELLNVSLDLAAASKSLQIWKCFRRAMINITKRIALRFGITPMELACFFRYRRKGASIDYLRKKRGLPALR